MPCGSLAGTLLTDGMNGARLRRPRMSERNSLTARELRELHRPAKGVLRRVVRRSTGRSKGELRWNQWTPKLRYNTTTEVSGMERIPYGLYSDELREETVKLVVVLTPINQDISS